jgi:hypothetical protein
MSLRNQYVHYRVHNTPLLYPILTYINATYDHLPSIHDWPETCGSPGQVHNLSPLQTDIVKHFRPRTGREKILHTHNKIADNFLRNSSACENLSYHNQISDKSRDVLAPLIGWRHV